MRKYLSFDWLALRVDRLTDLLPLLITGVFFALLIVFTLTVSNPFIGIGVALMVSVLLAAGTMKKLLDVKRILATSIYVANRRAYDLASECLVLAARVNPCVWLDEYLMTVNAYSDGAVIILRIPRREFEGITEAPEEGVSMLGDLIILWAFFAARAPFEAIGAVDDDMMVAGVKNLRWPDAFTRIQHAPPEERALIREAAGFDDELPELVTQLEKYLRLLQERASE